jgi:hypothetical protein
VLSLALDYNNADRVYAAAGQYLQSWGRNAAILRSSNRGATWSRTELPFRLGGNADGRGAGERLVVDPNLGSVLFLGTNENGLWKSVDSGVHLVAGECLCTHQRDLRAVSPNQRHPRQRHAHPVCRRQCDKRPDAVPLHQRRSPHGRGAGAPTGLIPNHADFDKAGTLYLSYADALGPNGMSAGQLWKLAPSTGTWTAISPRPSSSSTPSATAPSPSFRRWPATCTQQRTTAGPGATSCGARPTAAPAGRW